MEMILDVLNILALAGVGVCVLLIRKYLPIYTSKKAENLATKEDIGEITEIVERVKLAQASEMERLKNDLERERAERRAADERVNHMHRVQFETEFRVLSDIWAALASVRARVGVVRPPMRMVDEGETDEQRLERTFAAFVDAKNEFVKQVDFTMPFYPKYLHESLSAIIDILNDEYMDVKTTGASERNGAWWRRGAANIKAVNERTAEVADLIRGYLATLVVR